MSATPGPKDRHLRAGLRLVGGLIAAYGAERLIAQQHSVLSSAILLGIIAVATITCYLISRRLHRSH